MKKLLKDTDEKELRMAVNHVEGNRRTSPIVCLSLHQLNALLKEGDKERLRLLVRIARAALRWGN